MAAGTDFRVPADGSNPELNTGFICGGDCSRTAPLAKPWGVLVLPPAASWLVTRLLHMFKLVNLTSSVSNQMCPLKTIYTI